MKLTALKKRGTSLLCLMGMLIISTQASAQLVLNEMISANVSVLEDQFNNYPDWVEIYNTGDSKIDLNNYYLSDDSSNLKKWNLPEMSLAADDYLVVFASGKDITSGLTYWHTVINMGDEWRCIVPTDEISDEWKTSTSFTSEWKTGSSGFGYSDGDDATELPITISYYIQKEFQIESINEVNDAALFMDYDDGFVAYLNGTEIARSENMGTPGSPVPFDQPTGGNHEARMYGGGEPEAYYISEKIDLLKEGSNILAIEIHNVSATSSDMTGIPFLLIGFTGMKNDLLYRNPFFDMKETYPHTNFKIQSEGEAIFLSNIEGNIIDKIANTRLPKDFSYGRIFGDEENYGFFGDPTPGGPNDTPYATSYFIDSVNIVLQEESFGSIQKVFMESKYNTDEIHYTVDGSIPDSSDPVYSDILEYTNTTVIKARIYRPGSLPGPVTTKTVFVGKEHELPIISVSMDPDDLWDYNTGIYVMGPNAEAEAPYHGANFWQNWERPAHFELYNEKMEMVFAQDAGTKIFGGYSRAHAQRSMSFFARSSYGKGSFNYPLFRERNLDKYEAFVLRNDGNDWCNGLFRDGLTAYMTARMGVDHQAFEQYVMYLNGEYWGIINMREKINEHFIASNHDLYPEDVSILEGNGWLVYGSTEKYDRMYNYICNNDMSTQLAYDSAKTMMDVQNFMNYWAVNIYVDNKDWPGNNNKFWTTNAPGSLFRWISFDTDFGYSIWDAEAYKVNTLRFSLSKGEINWANELWATAMMRSLLKNQEFKYQYINTFADRMNTTFNPDFMVPVVDSFQQRVLSEAPAHYERWITNPNDWLSFNNWLGSEYNTGFVDRMRIYLEQRPGYMRRYLMQEFSISGTRDIKVDVMEEGSGYIHLNSIDIESYPFDGTYFLGIPIRLEAIPKPGYVFSHWAGTAASDSCVIDFSMLKEGTFIAVFEAVDSVPDIVINEINYASSPYRDTDDWVELYNNSGVAVDLTGWSLRSGYSADTFDIPAGIILPADGYIVLSRKKADYKKFYPELKPLAGNLPFGLASDKDGMALYTPDGNLHDFVTYESIAPWPEDVNGTGRTLELISPNLDNTLPGSWKASLDTIGTPGALNSQFKTVVDAVEKATYQDLMAFAYPSPFKEKTNISFKLPVPQELTISVYSLTGSLVDVISNNKLSEGIHNIEWIPSAGVNAGLYFINIKGADYNETLKVVFEK